MKRYTAFFVCCLTMLFATVSVYAQTGFAGSAQTGIVGQTGQVVNATVEQARTFGHGAPVIITGNIVSSIGPNRYIFRDSSGETVLQIGQREWMFFGSTIAPEDTIEISGEVFHFWPWGWRGGWHGGWGWNPGPAQSEVHARFMRKL